MTQADSDIVYIRNLVFDAIIGVLEHERRTTQPLCVSLELSVDTTPAAASENLSDTLDYAFLADAVEALAIREQCLLVETLAQKIADLALEQPEVAAVRVNVGKPQALHKAEQVGVEIYRRRA
ncbi:MAG: dihydroneopterin aldolase [bacterium]